MDKTKFTITVKEPDEIAELINVLELDPVTVRSYFEYNAYATIELVIDKALRVIGGRFIPVEEL